MHSGKKNPPVPHEIDIVRGSAYGIFSRGMVNYILTDEKAKDLLEWSRNTYSPDEHYWSTLHHTMSNPHLKTPGQYRGKMIGNFKFDSAIYCITVGCFVQLNIYW